MTETPNPHPHAGSEGPAEPPAYSYAHPPVASAQTDRNWASASHWGTLVAAWLAMGFIAPLVIMLTVGNQSPYVRRHAVESLNFQISLLIYGAVGFLVVLVTLGLGALIVVPVAVVAVVAALIFVIIASVKAQNGEDYRYPLTIRLVP